MKLKELDKKNLNNLPDCAFIVRDKGVLFTLYKLYFVKLTIVYLNSLCAPLLDLKIEKHSS